MFSLKEGGTPRSVHVNYVPLPVRRNCNFPFPLLLQLFENLRSCEKNRPINNFCFFLPPLPCVSRGRNGSLSTCSIVTVYMDIAYPPDAWLCLCMGVFSSSWLRHHEVTAPSYIFCSHWPDRILNPPRYFPPQYEGIS